MIRMLLKLKPYRTMALTVLSIAVLTVVHGINGYKFPPTFMILFVMFAAFYEGIISTIVCAIIVWFYYAFYFSEPHDYFHFTQDNLQRLVISGGVLTATAALGFILRHRSLAGLQKALDRLTASEEFMRSLIESAHDAFIAIDSNGRIINWNSQAEATFGWSKSEILSQPLTSTIIPPRYREAHLKGLERFMQMGSGPVVNKRFEIVALHRHGHEIPIEITIYPFKQGQATYFGAYLQDISERKKSQRVQLAQFAVTSILSEYASLKEAAPKLLEAICSHLEWSAGELWVQHDANTLRCKSFWSKPDEKMDAIKEAALARHLSIGEELPGQAWDRREPVWAGSTPTSKNRTLAFPIIAEDQVVGVMSFYISSEIKPEELLLHLMSDIGKRIGSFIQRRLAEQRLSQVLNDLEDRVEQRTSELANSNTHLAAANRLKDEFLATVSHELRTPLNVMQGHSELLLARYTFDQQVTDSLNAIYRNAKSQGHIINDLLDVSRIITGKLKLAPAKIQVGDLIRSAGESVAIAAEAKNIRVVEAISETAPKTITADFDRLQQVLWNLLANAVKFTPRDGTITIEVLEKSSKLEIAVTDTGIGIEPAFLPYVFERFRQEDASTTRKHGGLGLGMAIARHITELHGGTIEVLSEGKDKGSTFRVSLPLQYRGKMAVSEPAMARASEPASPELSLTGAKILVVDDQPDTLTLIKIILEKAGAQVSAAASAEEALDLKKKMNFDLLVSDIGMPGQDGYDLVQHFGAIPTIALTAYASETDRKKALAAGFQRHLTKPIERPRLIATIQDLLGK